MRKTIYIMLAEEKMKLDIASIFSKIYAYAVRICISLFITYLVTQCLIAVAYSERGYKAVGGAYGLYVAPVHNRHRYEFAAYA